MSECNKKVDDIWDFPYYYRKMIGFLIKKTFYDAWDNLFRVVLLNLGFVASLVIPILFPGLISFTPLSIVVAVVGVLWCCVYLAAAALSVKALSDYGSFGFADFGKNLKAGWPAGIIMALIGFFFFLVIKIILPFYFELNSLWGLLLGAVVFWTLVLSLVSFQFFFAIRARLDSRPLKMVKKCFIIFFDNPGFSIFTLLYTAVTLLISVAFAFLIPGPAGILLFFDEGLRLRLLKYDWLDANPPPEGSPKRRPIPWDVILIEEREKTGSRTFRNFVFPWKD
jgi:hypothetical protein